jgi:hypothetical protein
MAEAEGLREYRGIKAVQSSESILRNRFLRTPDHEMNDVLCDCVRLFH